MEEIKLQKKNLIIVESPAKAKTIEKILGSNFHVVASYGHVRDLPKSRLGVDVNDNFKPSYGTIKGKGEILKSLRSLAKKADKVYLASDPDREGEAIAWHIANQLKLDENDKNRIEFNEITESAVKNSIEKPRKIDMYKVNAQQARRILDRLVGYGISPFLWKSISSKTSAGRVQSVALKIICDLEDTIKKFVPVKYWEIKGEFEHKLLLNLYKVSLEKVDKITDEKIVQEIKEVEKKLFNVIESKVTNRSKNPPMPLKTSTLQQLASSYLGFSPSRTMRIAQGLYEGIDINGTHKGLITYMRTDSTRISQEALDMAKDYIIKTFGEEYVGTQKGNKPKPNQNIQDAHEGIRPTDVNLTPANVKKYLDKDQEKLYKLIWERFLISQLAAMKYDQFEIILEKDKFQFRGTLNKITFDGYYKIFKDEEELPLGEFPQIEKGENLKLNKLLTKEDFTKPPSRLTESSLVKKLEAEGIGRPSTYATIIDTLKKREYVELNSGKSLLPTSLGYEVKEKLDDNFPNIMNIKFTAGLENELDQISEGEKDWINVLREFNKELSSEIEKFAIIIEEECAKIVESNVDCPCGKGKMILKNGRFGRYLSCPNEEEPCSEKISLKGIDIPAEDIKNGKIFVKEAVEEKIAQKKGKSTDVVTDTGKKCLLKLGRFGSYLESEDFESDQIRISLPSEIRKMLANGTETIVDGVVQLKSFLDKLKAEDAEIVRKAGVCEKCGRPFKITQGRWGKFLSCSGYPECKNIKKIETEKVSKKKDSKTKTIGESISSETKEIKIKETKTKKTETKETETKETKTKETKTKETKTEKKPVKKASTKKIDTKKTVSKV
ncbi:MAG: type I DNA topoisomerase [Fusobacteriaceae bacterium]|jgi:DNA topoisomerase-1|nr:type I DNA topoisomerase [Fusobacteriaceae bacterium]